MSHKGRIFRLVTPEAASLIREFLGTPVADRFIEAGRIVSTRFLDNGSAERAGVLVQSGRVVLEHELIPFPSYPYEWPPEMLHRAAELTLEVSEASLDHGFWLKDASPYNVLFRGTEAVFVDLPSFEKRDLLDCTWRAYAQFTRTFLLVLLAARFMGRSTAEMLLLHRDGLDPQEVYRWASWRQRLRRVFFGMVSMPVWLDRRKDPDDTTVYQKRTAPSTEQACYVLSHVYRSLRRSLTRVAPVSKESTWTDYLDHKSLYTAEALAAKEAFVKDALLDHQSAAVLDVGCNEGRFSEIAAGAGARVVAIDSDAAVVGRLWRNARAKGLDILPLVVDLARPTPAMGWGNQECPSFIERARGQFDMVLMLAVVHHLMITERIPIWLILEMASSLTNHAVVIEFVGPRDPMFHRLVRGRDLLYDGLTVDYFEKEAACFFTTIRKQQLPGLDRWMFLFAKHPTPRATAY